MSKVKVFMAWYTDPNSIEENINQYLGENPGYMIEKIAMAATDKYIYATCVFTAITVYPTLPTIQPNGPFGPIGPAITKDGPNDDPWNGEFIPVGNLPTHPAT